MNPAEFLARPAPAVARDLLGRILTIGPIRARITETEAYHGEADRACHASKGCTPRTKVLYAAPGTLYVYRCYGIHWMLNLVTHREGYPSAVLIRSVAVEHGDDLVIQRRGSADPRATNGPGKVAQALGLDGSHHGLVLGTDECPLGLEAGSPVVRCRRGPRVGVAYAGPGWADRPWRFWIPEAPVVAQA